MICAMSSLNLFWILLLSAYCASPKKVYCSGVSVSE